MVAYNDEILQKRKGHFNPACVISVAEVAHMLSDQHLKLLLPQIKNS